MMATQERTDVHRPKEIRPEDYSWVFSYDTQPPLVPMEDQAAATRALEEWRRHFDRFVLEPIRKSTTTVYSSPYRCDHCGAHLRYGNLYFYEPAGGVIVIGDICAEETMEVPDRAHLEQKRIREAAKAARMAEAENKKARERRERAEQEFPEATALLETYQGENSFILDVSERFKRQGYLSEKQAAALVRAHHRDLEREDQRRKEAALIASGEIEPVPEGRHLITGEVVTDYWKDYGMGQSRHVMIVRDDRGFKVWCTVPSAIDTVDLPPTKTSIGGQRPLGSGDRVQFKATLEPSDRDPAFGFGKRPASAKLLEQAE